MITRRWPFLVVGVIQLVFALGCKGTEQAVYTVGCLVSMAIFDATKVQIK